MAYLTFKNRTKWRYSIFSALEIHKKNYFPPQIAYLTFKNRNTLRYSKFPALKIHKQMYFHKK